MKNRLFFLQNIILTSFAVILLFSFSGCGSGRELASGWPTQAIQIDGNTQDWQGSLQSFPEKKYSLGIKNDDKFLYLCFTTSDREVIFNAIRSGLNIDFKSLKDNSKDYTIKFPIIRPDALNKALSAFGNEMLEKEGISFLFQDILDNISHFSLIQDKLITPVGLKNDFGIEIKAGSTNELLVYEVKVPLVSGEFKYPIGALAGEKIDVIISTDPSKVAFREGMSTGGNIAPTGAGGRGGRSRASNVAQGNDGKPVITENFETAFILQLSKENK